MLKHLSISCEKATALVEIKNIFGLSWWGRYRLQMHQKVCSMCKHYEVQSKLIDECLKISLDQRKAQKVDLLRIKEQLLVKLK